MCPLCGRSIPDPSTPLVTPPSLRCNSSPLRAIASEISAALATSAEANGTQLMVSEKLGFLGTCPSNLGTGLRGSVMIVLEKLNEDVIFLEAGGAVLLHVRLCWLVCRFVMVSTLANM